MEMNMNILDINTLYRNNMEDLKKRVTPAQPAAKKSGTIDKNSKLFKVSQEFEAIFIKQMLNTMRKTVNKSGLLDGGQAEEIFEDMLYDNYAQSMAETANFGLADSIYRQLAANEGL